MQEKLNIYYSRNPDSALCSNLSNAPTRPLLSCFPSRSVWLAPSAVITDILSDMSDKHPPAFSNGVRSFLVYCYTLPLAYNKYL